MNDNPEYHIKRLISELRDLATPSIIVKRLISFMLKDEIIFLNKKDMKKVKITGYKK